MKLDLTGSIASVSATPQISKNTTEGPSNVQEPSSTSAATSSSAVDRTTFQSGADNVRALVSQALATPEVRQDKVDSIRQSMASGTYKFDAGKVADAMIASSKGY